MPSKSQRVSKSIFIGTATLIALLIILLVFFFPAFSQVVKGALSFLCYDIGWLFIITVIVIALFCVYLAFSRLGNIKLGGKNEPKQYSNFAWASMMFTTGLGTALVVMSYIEPVMFLENPPFGIEPLSDEAFEFALVPDQFLYGILAWLIYVPGVVAIGLALYSRNERRLRISSACKPVIGKHADRGSGKLIDILGNIAIIGGVSSALGLGVPIVTMLVNRLTGIPEGVWLTVAVLAIWTLLFGTSVYMGLDKGIKRLSLFNIYLFGAIIIFIATVNPVNQAISMWVNSLGLMLDSFGKLAFGTDPFGKSDFAQGWVVFYWAWWLAFAPMMGLFVARISRGRTIRQIIGGMICFGALPCMACFAWFGSYAVTLQHEGIVDLVTTLSTVGREEVFFTILETMPLAPFIEAAYIVLLFVFCATTIDSTAYVVASTCIDNLGGDEQPPRWMRMVWAIALLLFALGLVLTGGLDILQAATVATALPMVAIVVLLMISAFRGLRDATKLCNKAKVDIT